MKHLSFPVAFLFLLIWSSFSVAQNPEQEQLWLLTATITHNTTYQRDTTDSFGAGGYITTKESHSSSKTTVHGQITAVIENMANDPANEFYFDTDPGVPKLITITGGGSSNESSNGRESINGKMISAGTRIITESASASPEAGIRINYSSESKDVQISISFKGTGSDKGRSFYDEWKDYGREGYDCNIGCIAGCNDQDHNCNMTKTSKGYQANWKKNENKRHSTVDGTEYTTEETSLEVTIVPYKESDKPVVTLYGCSELGKDEQSNMMASGKPEGGKFRFWVEPENLFSVQADGESSANLTGATPGKGTLYVEYTTPEGKTNQTSQAASCVKIENYNGGQAIPQIALYYIDGKKLSGIKTVPLDAQPENANELVDFVSADNSVLSVVGQSGTVEITGSHQGKTTFQAKTNCGTTVVPAVNVEVVNCDEETIATLERMKEAAMENLVQATERLQKEAGSEEFEKARDELVESTVELLAKSALTIIGSGHAHGAVETAIEVAEAGESVSEMVASATSEEFNEKTIEATLKAVGSSATKALVGAMGVHEAAKKFGEIVGEIYKHETGMDDLDKSYEKAFRDLEKIQRRLQFCKSETEQPQAKQEPKTDPTPQPPKPTPKTTEPPKQKTQTTASTTTDEPTTGDDGVIGDPEPPTQPPKQVGLPYSPSDCGCNQSKELTNNSAGFSELGTGIKNLGDCVENFRSTSVSDYELALKDLSALTDSLSSSLQANPEAFPVKAKNSKPRLDELTKRVKSYDKSGTEFLNKMNKCPESVTSGMEIFKSVEKITVDSIKTNY